MTNMRVDWEGEVKYQGQNLYAHADYKYDFDDYGNHVIVVTKARAFDDREDEIEVDEDFKDHLAEIIQEEMDNAA